MRKYPNIEESVDTSISEKMLFDVTTAASELQSHRTLWNGPIKIFIRVQSIN